jgi:Mrp family chromosome partitioning ATPase
LTLPAATSENEPASEPPDEVPDTQPRQPATLVPVEKPLIARLQESDVIRTLGAILAIGGSPDVTRMGWPTMRTGLPPAAFFIAMRELRAALAKHSAADTTPVMAVIGPGTGKDRSIAALNVARAAARDGARVLMIDADHTAQVLSKRIGRLGKGEAGPLNLLGIGTRVSSAIKTVNGIAILPAVGGSDVKAGDAVRKAIARARAAGDCDLIILDGPAVPWSAADHRLLDLTDGLVATLPTSLDINECMNDIIAALGDTERKLIGVIVNELFPAAVNRQRDKQYA